MTLRPCILRLARIASANGRAGSLSYRTPPFSPNGNCNSRSFITVARDRSSGFVKQLKGTSARVDDAITFADAPELRHNLNDLRKLVHSLPKTVDSDWLERYIHLTQGKVDSMVNILSRSGKEEDGVTADHLLRDCVNTYNVQIKAETLKIALGLLVCTKQVPRAYSLLHFFRERTTLRPGHAHWQIVLDGYSSLGDIKQMKKLISIMKVSGPFPGRSHYAALIGAMLSSEGVSVAEVGEVLDEMLGHRITYDDSIHASLCLRGSDEWEQLAEAYRTNLAHLAAVPPEQTQKWITGLARTLKTKGRNAFVFKFLRCRAEGLCSDDVTCERLVRAVNASTLDMVKFLAETVDVRMTNHGWEMAIQNAVSKADSNEALRIIEGIKNDGVELTPSMLAPVIHSLCNGRIKEPNDAAIDQCLDLFRHVNKTALRDEETKSLGLVYNTLLRALSASSNTSKHFPVALDLLQEMQRQNVLMDSRTSTTIAVLLVRSAGSFDEAVAAYKVFADSEKCILTAKGFEAILSAFCKLEFVDPNYNDYLGRPQLMLPPPKLYYEIIADMQKRGIKKTVEIYTILFSRHGFLASRVRSMKDPKRRSEVAAIMRDVIKATHREVMLDPSIAPDPLLLNAIMDAYGRAGAAQEALNIWDHLTAIGPLHSSVSIIFDVIGHNRLYDKVDSTVEYLNKAKFPWNRRNHNALLECLCRLGRLDDAVDFSFKNMLENPDLDMRPDVETLKILFTFGAMANRGVEIRSLAKVLLPDAYAKLGLEPTLTPVVTALIADQVHV